MKNIILYLFFKLIVLTIKVLPGHLRYLLGSGIGKLTLLLKSRQKVARDNLTRAFPDKTDQEIEKILTGVYRHLGLMLIEFILLEGFNEKNYSKYISIENEEILKEIKKQQKGIIIYGAHFGNWEWMGTVISLMGYSLNAIVQEQNNSYFDQYINQIRQDKGVKIIPRGKSVRQAYRALQKGELLFILGDQDARERGWMVNFFNQPASTYPGVVELAQRTGAVILPTFLIREKWGCHQLIFGSPYQVKSDLSQTKKEEILQQLTTELENKIRQYPEQWLWLHRRWKT